MGKEMTDAERQESVADVLRVMRTQPDRAAVAYRSGLLRWADVADRIEAALAREAGALIRQLDCIDHFAVEIQESYSFPPISEKARHTILRAEALCAHVKQARALIAAEGRR